MKNIVNKQIFEALSRKFKVGSINFFRAILCIRTTRLTNTCHRNTGHADGDAWN